MDISFFLTTQNPNGKQAGQAPSPLTGDKTGALNASGFFGFLVDQLANDQKTQELKTQEAVKAQTIATTVNLGDAPANTLPANTPLLAMSGEELLALLRESTPEQDLEKINVLAKGESSLTITIKGADDLQAVPFVLNGFFIKPPEVKDQTAFLDDYKAELSAGLRDFITQAIELVNARAQAETILTGYTPEQITHIGDEIAALVTEITARSHGGDDEKDEHKPLQENDSSLFTENPVLGENLIKDIIEGEGGAAQEELLKLEIEKAEAQRPEIQELAHYHAERIQELVNGFVSLLKPQEAKIAESANDEVAVLDLGNIPADQEPSDALAAVLNNIIVGAGETKPVTPVTQVTPTVTQAATPTSEIGHSQYRLTDADIAVAPQETRVGQQASNMNAQAPAQNVQNTPPAPVPVLPMATMGGENFAGLLTPATYEEGALQSMGLAVPVSTGLAATGTSAILTQAQSAAHPHPGTQMVSATLQKAANNGQSQTLSIQLDPPDLGRVEIKMSFGKDSKVKAVLTVEKPETFLMLQRDAGNLERALQSTGLDAEGGVAFELAEQGFEFSHGQNDRGGGHDQGGTGASGDGEMEELIESQMTWQVDPETGYMRYNILA